MTAESLRVRPGAGGLRFATPVLRVGRFARRKPLGAASGLVALTFVLVAIFAPYIETHDIRQMTPNAFAAPSTEHWFGTDNFGRDLFSRIVHGSRLSLFIGLIAVAIGTGAGATVGIISGYLGGRTDLLIQRVIDAVLAFPGLILALVLVGLVGPSPRNVAIAIGLVTFAPLSRVVRGPVMSIKQTMYIEAARASGATNSRIMLRHVLPNVAPVIIVLATALIGQAILIESGISFLGLGPSPDTPTWGQMLSGEALRVMEAAPWMAIFPGLAITIVVLAFNLFGDALRDVWDPHLRGR